MWRDQQSGAVVELHSEVRALRPNVSFPVTLTDEIITAHAFDTVTLTAPAYDPMTQAVAQASPALIAGVWTQQWVVSNLSPEQVAEKQAAATEAARVAAVDAAIGSDVVVASLKGMTNAQFDQWWGANVTNAAQAITVLKRIARIVIRKAL